MRYFPPTVDAGRGFRARVRAAILAATAACIGTGADAATDSYAPFESGQWHGFAHRGESTGAFSHCSLRAIFDGGTTLAFLMTASYRLYIGLANPNWNLDQAAIADTGFEVDGRQIQRGRPTSVKSMSLRFAIDDSAAAYDALRRGRALTVFGASQTIRFSLDGTFHALPLLAACVDAATAGAAPSRNPFARPDRSARVTNPFAADPHARGKRREDDADLRRSFAEILDAAGFREWRFVDPSGDALLAWESRSFTGFFTITDTVGSTQRQVLDDMLADAQDICTGDVAYGITAPSRHAPYEIREVVMSCPVRWAVLRISVLAGFHDDGYAAMVLHRSNPGASYGAEEVSVMADLKALFTAIFSTD